MSLGQTAILGLIAGITIFIGLPVGRMHAMTQGTRVLLNAVAVGILTFLLWDVLAEVWEPVEEAVEEIAEDGELGPAAGYGALFVVGTALGLLVLVWYEKWVTRRSRIEPTPEDGWQDARRLAVLIATGIGLHNFAEGLAIGQSAASGKIALATVLVVGFALHNATEGFGIVAPLTGAQVDVPHSRRPSWGFLLLLGVIGGAPTLVGTVVGHSFVSTALSVLFLSLAAGSILYVIIQLIIVGGRAGQRDLLAYGILIGLFAGFITYGVVEYAGA